MQAFIRMFSNVLMLFSLNFTILSLIKFIDLSFITNYTSYLSTNFISDIIFYSLIWIQSLLFICLYRIKPSIRNFFILNFVFYWFFLFLLFYFFEIVLLLNIYFILFIFISSILFYLFCIDYNVNIYNSIKLNIRKSTWNKEYAILILNIKRFDSLVNKFQEIETRNVFINMIFRIYEKTIQKNNWIIYKNYWDKVIWLFEWNNKEDNCINCWFDIVNIFNNISNSLKRGYSKNYLNVRDNNQLIAMRIEKVLENENINIQIWIDSWNLTMTKIYSVNFTWWEYFSNSFNIIQKLEFLNSKYKTNILITENTAKKISNNITVRKVDKVIFKWSNNWIYIYEALNKNSHFYKRVLTVDSYNIWNKMIEHYFKKEFTESYKYVVIYNNMTNNKDYLWILYKRRLEWIINELVYLPPDWDWTWTWSMIVDLISY